MIVCSIFHWKMSFREIHPYVARAMHSALDVGDVVYGSLSIALFAGFQYYSGENISSIDQFARSKCIRIHDLCSNAIPLWTKPGMQFFANLRSASTNWKDLTILSGEFMDEEEYLKEVSAKNHKMLMMLVWTHKAMLALCFGFYEIAANMYEKMRSNARLYRISYTGANVYFNGAMIYYERFRTTGRRKYLKEIQRFTKGLRRFEAGGSPNVSVCLLILQAEDLSLKSKDTAAIIAAYTKGVEAAKKDELVQFEALANERLSAVLDSLACHELSVVFLDRAIDLCLDPWGAIAKHNWLLEQRSLRLATAGQSCVELSTSELNSADSSAQSSLGTHQRSCKPGGS
ncbi:histidine kinase [Fragilaria crotonensis]|nr:histidine kinase [Fragilaria crotonensis]